MRLAVEQTWDGVPVPARERTEVNAHLDARHLHVIIDAPCFGDRPPLTPAGATDRLWEHEVVELFLVGRDGRYVEVEVGPYGHHLVLVLDGVRNVVASHVPLALDVRRAGPRWTARAALERRWVPEPAVRANAFAIHGVGSDRRFLAHAPVPGAHPDFHRLDRFVPVSARLLGSRVASDPPLWYERGVTSLGRVHGAFRP